MTSDRTEVMRLDDIVPYWRNPRLITEEAVNAVAESIRRYGYQQPVVVDEGRVIIMGHTRYAAMRRMGVTEVEVRVAASLPADKVKRLRVLDNRLHEYTRWDFDALVSELDELDAKLMGGYFPEVVPEDLEGIGTGVIEPGTADDNIVTDGLVSLVEFVCPSCFSEFQANVTREQVLSGRIEVQRAEA